jgi:Amt family ammonium transporter
VAYLGFGFAFQFGGIGLSANAPAGLAGLDKAWSPFPIERWAFIGLQGFFLSSEGSPNGLSLVHTLALHRLPMAISAGMIPVLALGDRVNRMALIVAGIVSTAMVFPIAGAWVWGGGWLAMLGLSLNLGHGAIDAAGSGVVFFASACVTLVALRAFGERIEPGQQPITHKPLLALLGMVAFGMGWSAWAISDPLLSRYLDIDFSGAAVVGLISAAAAATVSLAYRWFTRGRFDLSMLVRGGIAGWVAVGASVWFIPSTTAVAIGTFAGILSIIAQYGVALKWGWTERAALSALYAAAGAWGVIAPGLFADGAFGSDWNDVVTAQGVRGLLYADPGQFSAQAAALIAIGVLAVGVATVILTPFGLLARRERLDAEG